MSPFFLKAHISETFKYEFSTVKALHEDFVFCPFVTLLFLIYFGSFRSSFSLPLFLYLTPSVPAYDMFCDIVDEMQILLESTQAVNIPFTLVLP